MFKKFHKIVCIDKTNLKPWAFEKLQEYSLSDIIIYDDYPENEEEIIKRIGDADSILVSWRTKISTNIIREGKSLKYIGMCCSLIDKESSNVDIDEANACNIEVRGVKDYGDEGVVEFVFAQLISLAKGLHKDQWKDFPTELKGKKLGIIGFGTLGKMVADVALAFGMNVFYFSRTRKTQFERPGLEYLPLKELLPNSDVISTHLPKNTIILGKKEFALLKPNSVLINTSIGPTFDMIAFKDWISNSDNFAIIDGDAGTGYGDFYKQYWNILYSEKAAGMTNETYERLSEKVLENISKYINS